MATKPLSTELLQEALDAVSKHGSVRGAARALGLPTPTFQHRYSTATMKIGMPERPAPPANIIQPINSFDDAWQKWQTAIGMSRERYAGPAKTRKQSGTQKILVVPDLHAPFFEQAMFADMLEREKDADKVICIGDLSDSYALSTFTQYRRVPFDEEWASVTLVMQTLSERFPEVECVIGNHDGRLEKRLRERLTPDMVDAVKFLTGGILCPITALSRRFPNVTVANHPMPNGESIDWFTTCGDAWLGHPEKYSRTPGAALRAVEDWLSDNEQSMGLSHYKLIIIGHTHQLSLFPWRSNQLLVECGCLCAQQGYMTTPRIGGRPQRRGYVTFMQTDGRTDLNSVRLHWFDAEERTCA